MAQIEANFRVLPGKVITGKHQVYKAGDFFPASEACGDMANAVKSGIVEKIEVEDIAAAKELASDELGEEQAGKRRGRPKKDMFA